jgi:RNA polymerase sigma-70 factor (ECF subfamily)
MAGLSKRARQEVADEALLRSLYREHGGAMLAYAIRLTGDRTAAEDVVQETLVRAWQHPDSLVNGRGSIRGWLLTVVRNLVTDKARARASRPREVAEPPVDVAVAGDHADGVVNSLVVGAALGKLSAEHRDVLEQIYLLGATSTEAAKALGIPLGTVKSRSYHALRALRALLPGVEAGLERSVS